MSSIKNFMPKVEHQIATILSSGTISDSVKCYGCTPVALSTPSNFEGTQLQFDVSIDGGLSFKRLHDRDNIAIAYAVTADRTYHIDYSVFAGVDEIKVVSNANESSNRKIEVKLIP